MLAATRLGGPRWAVLKTEFIGLAPGGKRGGAVRILLGVWLGWLGKGMLSTEVGTGGLGWGHALSARCLGHMGHGWWLGHPCM